MCYLAWSILSHLLTSYILCIGYGKHIEQIKHQNGDDEFFSVIILCKISRNYAFGTKNRIMERNTCNTNDDFIIKKETPMMIYFM